MRDIWLFFLIWWRETAFTTGSMSPLSLDVTTTAYLKLRKVNYYLSSWVTQPFLELSWGFIKGRHRENWPAVRMIQPAWFDHLEGSFSYNESQFRRFCPPLETSCPPAENVTLSQEPCTSKVNRLIVTQGWLNKSHWVAWLYFDGWKWKS